MPSPLTPDTGSSSGFCAKLLLSCANLPATSAALNEMDLRRMAEEATKREPEGKGGKAVAG